MPIISTYAKVVFWIIAAIGGAVFAIFGNELGKNIVYFFSKRGRPPTKRPIHIWIMGIIGLATSITFGALAAFAPSSPETTVVVTTMSSPSNSKLHYSRCGFNTEIGNSSISPAYCISVVNQGQAVATDVKITIQSFDLLLSVSPVAIQPPYDNLVPRTAENGTWIVYEVSLLPEMAPIQLWIEFTPSEEGMTVSENELHERVQANEGNLFGTIEVSAVCTNCTGFGDGNLTWPPLGVTLPPLVNPIP